MLWNVSLFWDCKKIQGNSEKISTISLVCIVFTFSLLQNCLFHFLLVSFRKSLNIFSIYISFLLLSSCFCKTISLFSSPLYLCRHMWYTCMLRCFSTRYAFLPPQVSISEAGFQLNMDLLRIKISLDSLFIYYYGTFSRMRSSWYFLIEFSSFCSPNSFSLNGIPMILRSFYGSLISYYVLNEGSSGHLMWNRCLLSCFSSSNLHVLLSPVRLNSLLC